MKWIIFVLAAISISYCHSTRKLGLDDYMKNTPCFAVLRDLKTRFYKVDKDYYGLKLYKPSQKERVQEFQQIAFAVNQELGVLHKDCVKAITPTMAIDHFGKPNKIDKQSPSNAIQSLLYRFNFGNHCPRIGGIGSEKYAECNVLVLEFDEHERLSHINLSNLTHGIQ